MHKCFPFFINSYKLSTESSIQLADEACAEQCMSVSLKQPLYPPVGEDRSMVFVEPGWLFHRKKHTLTACSLFEHTHTALFCLASHFNASLLLSPLPSLMRPMWRHELRGIAAMLQLGLHAELSNIPGYRMANRKLGDF